MIICINAPHSSLRQTSCLGTEAAWLFFSRYIKLFEVCHPPVVMNILGCMISSFRLHQTVWRVLPASYGELNIKLHGYFFS